MENHCGTATLGRVTHEVKCQRPKSAPSTVKPLKRAGQGLDPHDYYIESMGVPLPPASFPGLLASCVLRNASERSVLQATKAGWRPENKVTPLIYVQARSTLGQPCNIRFLILSLHAKFMPTQMGFNKYCWTSSYSSSCKLTSHMELVQKLIEPLPIDSDALLAAISGKVLKVG